MNLTPILYQRINQILESALELPEDERSAFLDRACSGDAAVRSEVEELLAHASEVPSEFLLSPLLGDGEAAGTVDSPVDASTLDYAGKSAGPAYSTNLGQAIPGYTMVKVLGKGGMGIVYLAQDLKLPRLVALKVMRSGADANEKERSRFDVEAATVAKLVHPNIVQIHAMGEHAGSPYFALEYVPGGTLASKMEAAPIAPEQGAHIVLTLAKAVQVAHQHGIVHRDLKPANVLLTTDGTPKITDFGLAKQLDVDQGLSHTGDIMGTPAYMAPEQAFGRIQDIGPATDVYALGAILYEMLTGRPPFQGANHLETLDQVRFHDPVPPRQVQPKSPRDLETISLKCLHKEPKDRYTSALALAQDLERYLAGEAILARPEGVLARSVRKLRRNPVSVLVVALVLVVLTAGFIVYRSRDTSRIQELVNRLDDDRKETHWTDAKIQQYEALIEQLAALAPERRDDAKARLSLSLLESGTLPLKTQGSLQPDAKAYVERMIAELKTRDAQAARVLDARFQERLRDWGDVFELKAPKKSELAQQKFASAPKPAETLLTEFASNGNVQLEAVWAGWEDAAQLGLTVQGDAEKGSAGYAFLLETIPAAGKSTFADLRHVKEARVQFRILRNGVLLRREELPMARLPKGPLALTAERVDNRLRFLFATSAIIDTRDLVPLPPRGYFGVVLGKEASIRSLIGRQQALPIKPGKLEFGDELFAHGKFTEAQEYYGKQTIDLLGTPDGLEARFKSSLTLEFLNQRENAMRGYEALVKEGASKEDSKWVFLALFQLWVDQLRAKNLDGAEVWLDRLLAMKAIGKREELMLYVPQDLRDEVMQGYREGAGGLGFLRYDPNRLRNAQRIVEIEELLEVPPIYRGWTQRALLRVLRSEGRLSEAVQNVRKWLKELPPDNDDFGITFMTEYGWIMRELKAPDSAFKEVNRRLLEEGGGYRIKTLPLLLERARLFAAMGNLANAESDIRDFLKFGSPEQKHYRNSSDAYLMLGLILEAQGQPDKALEAWRNGRYKGDFNDAELGVHTAGGIGLINLLLLDSLCREVDDLRLENLARNVLKNQPESLQLLNRFDPKGLFRAGTAISNRVWYTPKGKEVVKKMVMQTCSFQEFVRLPYQALAAELITEEAIVGKLTDEQEKILWQLTNDAFSAYAAGKVTEIQLAELGYLWKKGPLPIFGISTLKGIDPALRGPAAYFLGLRFQRMSRPADEVFQIALANAPKNSALERLTRAELEKAGKTRTP